MNCNTEWTMINELPLTVLKKVFKGYHHQDTRKGDVFPRIRHDAVGSDARASSSILTAKYILTAHRPS
jgi:hypothetical protein